VLFIIYLSPLLVYYVATSQIKSTKGITSVHSLFPFQTT